LPRFDEGYFDSDLGHHCFRPRRVDKLDDVGRRRRSLLPEPCVRVLDQILEFDEEF
jgi:hypothetical protein